MALSPQQSSRTDWASLLGPVRREPGSSLKHALYKRIVAKILDGRLAPGLRLPSSRELARQMSLSRNTVIQCYDKLVDEGYVASRPRSGIYVTDRGAGGTAVDIREPAPRYRLRTGPGEDASDRSGMLCGLHILRKTSRWRACRYPFVYGQFDAATFPIRQWRECERETLSMGNLSDWATDPYDDDSPLLVRQLLTRILPRRGVWADEDDLLITAGAQNALYMLAQLLVEADTPCIVEDPCYPDGKSVFAMRSRHVISVPVDDEGIRVDLMPEGARVILLTPALQYPTTVTLSPARRAALYAYARRNDALIIEDDYDGEIFFSDRAPRALKSDDPDGRVILVGSFSKNLAPGLRIGFTVASRRLIRDLRLLRRLIMRSPPMNNQHTLGKFIESGYYDSHAHRLRDIYRHRSDLLAGSIAQHMPGASFRTPTGGSALWVRLPPGVRSEAVGYEGIRRSLYAEIGDWLFNDLPDASFMRLGLASIADERIDGGIRVMSEIIGDLMEAPQRAPDLDPLQS